MKVKEPITDYAKLDQSKSYNFLDYMSWQFKERVELIKGKIFKMSPAANTNHQGVSTNLSREFANYFYKKECRVYIAPFDVRLFPLDSGKDKTVVQPDLCVICDIKQLNKQGCLGPPDLVIEIISKGNSKHDLKTKFDLYEESKVKEYWVVDPFNKIVLVYCLENDKFIGLKPFTEVEAVSGRLFPELQISVEEIFYGMLPD